MKEVSELRNEVTSISSKKDEECAKYQKLLMEENEKSKMLSNEVERLQKLLNESCGLKDGMAMQGKSASPGPNKQSLKVRNAAGQNNDRNDEVVSQEVSSSSMIMTRKRRQEARTMIKDGNPIHGSDGPSKKRIKESARDLPKVSSGLCCDQLPVCCRASFDKTGDGESTNCQFQDLIEYLVDMKLSAVNQNGGTCISVIHQTSGYTFSLT